MSAAPQFQDERLGLSSASAAPRVYNCPGSVALEAICENYDTKEATSGTKVHGALDEDALPIEEDTLLKWLNGTLTDADLTPRELMSAQLCRSLEILATDEWSATYGFDRADLQTGRETRWFLRERFKIIFSGKPDVWFLSQDRRALVLDDKSGFGRQDKGSSNLQLRALAVLMDEEEGGDLLSVDVGIIQPGAGMNVVLAHYNRENLDAANLELRQKIQATREPNAPRYVGDWCRWCKAAAICPERQAQLVTLQRLYIGNGEARREMLSDEQLYDYLRMAGQAKKLIGALESEAIARIKDGRFIGKDGMMYTLEDSSGRRKCKDVPMLRMLLQGQGITASDLLDSCASLRIADLELLIRAKKNMKAKEAAAWINDNLPIDKSSSGTKLEHTIALPTSQP